MNAYLTQIARRSPAARSPRKALLWLLLLLFALLALSAAPVRAAINVTVAGPGGSASQSLPDAGGTFDLSIPLNRNAVNRITVTATDAAGRSAAQELAVTQVSLDQIVVSRITAERLSVEQVEQLVNNGVIKLDDPQNYNVSTFDIVLTIASQPVSVKIPVVTPKEATGGWETYRLPWGRDSGGGPPRPQPVEVVVFEEIVPGPPGHPPVSIPGVLVIEGRIKSLKEFYSVRLLLMNTSGIFTLSDVTATIQYPNGGLTSILPADGIISFDQILPGNGDTPGQKEKEWIVRGDEIGVRDILVSYGGHITGAGIPEGVPIPFNGSAQTNVEVKGPPTFDVQVSHPDSVVQGVPYELKVDITNTGDIAAMYASLALDVGADGRLVRCALNPNPALEPLCEPIEGSDERNLGHILPGESVTQVFTINPLRTGDITSCMAAADQNLSLRVVVGTIGCLVGEFPPGRISSDGSPAVTVLPTPNADGVGTDSPVVAFFSKLMRESTVTTGPDGTFNVYDSGDTRVPGQMRFSTLNERTVAIWQVKDDITNRLKGSASYTVRVTTGVSDVDGFPMTNEWLSTFRTTGSAGDDVTPPTLALTVKAPVDPNYVLPGQIIKVDAYAADQGSGVARVEARLKDLDEPGATYQLVDQKTVFQGDLPPYVFSIDSANLLRGHAYQLLGTALDGNGNLRDATISFLVAATADAPTVVLPADPPAPVPHGISVDVTPVAYTGAVRQVRLYLDGAALPFKTVTVAPFQARLSTLDLSLGVHTVKALALDPVGQLGEDTLTFTLAENLNVPVVTFPGQSGGTSYAVGSSVLVSPRVEDPVGVQRLEYYLDGALRFSGLAPILLDTSGLSQGPHTVTVLATNTLGRSNDPNDPSSSLSFTVVEPPPGPPPAPPTVTSTSPPAGGLVSVQGTAVAGARVDIQNTATGLVVSANAAGNGAFSGWIQASAGDVLRVVAYDFTASQDPSGATDVTVPAPLVLDHIAVAPATMSFTAANAYQDVVVTGHYVGGSAANLTAQATFSSSDPTVAAVNGVGRVVALKSGSAVVTATVADKQAQLNVTVDIVTLVSLTVDPTGIVFPTLGVTRQLGVTGHYSNGSTQPLGAGVSYSSGNLSVAEVSGTGLVRAKANGTTQISVSYPGAAPTVVDVLVDTALDPLPAVAILGPPQGTQVERGHFVSVSVRATDALGGVVRVNFEVSGETSYTEARPVSPPSSSTTATFDFAVAANAVVGGQIHVAVRAEDTLGQLSPVASLDLLVADNTAPSVSVTQPVQQARFNYGDSVTVSVSAFDAVGVTEIRYETTGALAFSETRTVVPASVQADAAFTFQVPYGVPDPDVRILAFARDAAGHEGAASPVDVILTGADITPPDTRVTAVSEPGAGSLATVSYEVTSGLSDLDHVELYFRRNGIGTFNRYTGSLGTGDARYAPAGGNAGTISFDSTRMGGDGVYEFYSVGVDLVGNREPAPTSAGELVVADRTTAFEAGTVWTTIDASTTIPAGPSPFDDRNLRIQGAGVVVTVDGRRSFRNVDVLNGAALTQIATTPTVEHGLDLSVWTLSIDSASAIDVTGRGYLGGNKAGIGETAHTVGFAAGAQRGNGGSYGGTGGHYSGAGANATNPIYGSLTDPTDLGSGGGGWSGDGGDGGGRVLLTAINVAADGSIRANGGISSGSASGEGSGGSINIVTRTLSGYGAIQANGGGVGNNHTGGGGGRIAVRHLDLSTYSLPAMSAAGGLGHYGSGGYGTIFLLEEGLTSGELVVAGQGPNSLWTDLALDPGQIFSAVRLQNGARVIAQSPLVVSGTLRLSGNSVLTHPEAAESGLRIEASRVIVETGSAIDVTGRGYPGGGYSTHGDTAATLGGLPGSVRGCGGSYGGRGGCYSGAAGPPNLGYGDPKRPSRLGSGGGSWSGSGGYGGGYARIVATEAVVVDGAIRADGGLSSGTASGEGSGGSVWISTSRLGGGGTISANGGGPGNNHSGGGGGRVAVYADYVDSQADLEGLRNITAFRGRGYYENTGGSTPSSAGTVYVKLSSQPQGDLFVDDNITDGAGQPNGTSPMPTTLPLIGPGIAASVSADTLTADGLVPFLPEGLVGLRLNPDLNQDESFEIASNTANTIRVVTPNENGRSFGSISGTGKDYVGIWTFDNVVFRRGGFLEVGDFLRALDRLNLAEHGLLTHPQTTATYEGRLEVEARTLVIDETSGIDVTGRGYLGGGRTPPSFGETAQTVGLVPGALRGNGGSYGGLGGHYSGADSARTNPLYGSLTDPTDLGSGGGSWGGDGGDGGGRIFVTATDMTVEGFIRADGGIGSGSASGEGSGGTVNIATGSLAGNGFITANGGGPGNNHTGGGGGRIAIRYGSGPSLALPLSHVQVWGGDGYYGDGGHGTVYLRHGAQIHGDLVVDGFNRAQPVDTSVIPGGLTFDNITLRNGAKVVADNGLRALGAVRLEGGAFLTHTPGHEAGLQIDSPRVVVDSTSAIDVTGRGYPGGGSSAYGEAGTTAGGLPGSARGCGGSYGGRGGRYGGSSGQPNLVYGDPRRPDLLGSGGGSWGGNGGPGGGLVRIIASEEVVVDGAIRADGGMSSGSASGEGSGGSVWISTATLGGSGTISADGAGPGNNHTGGGGGRVALYLDVLDPAADLDGLRSVSAFRGRGYPNFEEPPPAAGTIYVKYADQTDGDLIIDDNMVDGSGLANATSPSATTLPLVGPGSAGTVGADTLSVDGIVPLPEGGLLGIRLNPDLTQDETFEIIANTETAITVNTPNEHGASFASIAAPGKTYGAAWTFDNVVFRRGGYLELGDFLKTTGTFDLKEYGRLTHPETTTLYEGGLVIEVGILLIDANSRIDVTGRGYLGGGKTGLGDTAHTVGFAAGAGAGNGGSYGGAGGHFDGAGGSTTNPAYGDSVDPEELGSGGGSWGGSGGDGGGRVFITAGVADVDGQIRADGDVSVGSASGDGSGGTVQIVADTLTGIGRITANGGGNGTHIGGGGGRIVVRHGGALGLPAGQVTATGGAGYPPYGQQAANGQPGTVHIVEE